MWNQIGKSYINTWKTEKQDHIKKKKILKFWMTSYYNSPLSVCVYECVCVGGLSLNSFVVFLTIGMFYHAQLFFQFFFFFEIKSL